MWHFPKGGFVKTGKANSTLAIGDVLRWAGNALIGGDMSGDRRGHYAFDMQTLRMNANEVASGLQSVAVGLMCRAEGEQATAIGVQSVAEGDYSFGLGTAAAATGYGSMAVGYAASATGSESLAIGARALARVDKTVALGGPVCIRADGVGTPAGQWWQYFSGAEVIIMSGTVNLKTVTDYTVTLPAGCKLWLNEVGVICTIYDAVTVRPTVRFGVSGDLARHLAATVANYLADVGRRHPWTTILYPDLGETTITAGVTSGAVATAMKGRFYWKGLLVEDE